MLEMLSQARAISFAVTPSALETSLLASDEIKPYRPPYNAALTATGVHSPHVVKTFALARIDRLRVLTTELKRLVAAGPPVALRLGIAPAAATRDSRALWWV